MATPISPDIQAIIDAITGAIPQYNPQPFKYGKDQKNQARDEAHTEFDPYFKRQLDELLKGINTQKGYAREDLDTVLGGINTQRGYADKDFRTALDNIYQRQGYAQSDADTTQGRLNQQRGYLRNDLADQLKQQLGQVTSNFQNRGLLRSGGLLANQEETQRLNQKQLQRGLEGFDQQGQDTQTNLQRHLAGLNQENNQVQEGYGRQKYGFNENELLAQRGYNRGVYGLNEQQRTGKYDIGQRKDAAIAQYMQDAYDRAVRDYLRRQGQFSTNI